jgi:DNA-binding MarR family transcriptional regulator
MVEREKFSVEESLPYLIVRVGHVLSRGFAGQMETVGLSVRQFAILTEVHRTDGVGSAELARAMGVTPQSAGEQVELMVERGLLKRDAQCPGRKAGIHLTAKGRREFERALRVAAAYEEHLTAHLGAGGKARFAKGLEEMARRV